MSTPTAELSSLAFRETPVRKFWFDDDDAPPRSLEQERLHRQQRLAGAFRLFAHIWLFAGSRRAYHRARSRVDRSLLGQSARPPFRPHPRVRSSARQPSWRNRDRRWSAESGGFCDSCGNSRSASRHRRRRPHAFAVRQGMVHARPQARSADPGFVRRSTKTMRCSTISAAWCSTPAKACAIAEALGARKAVILKNHGILTAGPIGRSGRMVVYRARKRLPYAIACRSRRQAAADLARDGRI